MVTVSSARVAKYFEDGKITYAEAVSLVVDARSHVASTRAAYQSFLTSYAALAGQDWKGGETALASTADEVAVRLVLSRWLESVGFDKKMAEAQGGAVGDLWGTYLRAGAEAQKRAFLDTQGLSVKLRAPNPAPAPAAGARPKADAVTVELAGSAEGQAVIRSAFTGGITGEKVRTLVYHARIFVKKPVATKQAEIQEALGAYLSAHGFPAENAAQLARLIEAAWRGFNERGEQTSVDVSAVAFGRPAAPPPPPVTPNRGGGGSMSAKAAVIALSGSQQGQDVLAAIFKDGKITGPETRTLVYHARILAKLPDTTADGAKLVPALGAYLKAHGFGAAPAADVAALVDAAWRSFNTKGAAAEVDVSAVRFVAAGGASSAAELSERYRLLDFRLSQLKDRVKTFTPPAPVVAALARSAELQAANEAVTGGLGPAALAEQSVITGSAREVLDAVERALTGLETYRGFLAGAPDLQRKGYFAAADAIYAAYAGVLARLFDVTAGPAALAAADEKAAELPYQLVEVDLAALESRPAGAAALEPSRQAIVAWVKRTRTEVAALGALVKGKKPKEAIALQAELVRLGIHAMGQWETTLRAHESRKDGIDGFNDLVAGYQAMAKAAAARSLTDLRQRLVKNASDATREALYAGLPPRVREPRLSAGYAQTFVAAARRAGAPGPGTVENLIASAAGGPARGPVEVDPFAPTPEDPLGEGRLDLRGATVRKDGDETTIDVDRRGHHIHQTIRGRHTEIVVTGPRAPLTITVEAADADRIYLSSIDVSRYDENAFRALRSNAAGEVTQVSMPLLEATLLSIDALSKDGYSFDKIKDLLRAAFGPSPRGRGDPRYYEALRVLSALGHLLATIPGEGGSPAFTLDQAHSILQVVAKRAPYGKRGEELRYYQRIGYGVALKLGTEKKPSAPGVAALSGILARDARSREQALLVFLRDASVGGEGAAELTHTLASKTDWAALGKSLVDDFQRNPSSPEAYAAVQRWYDDAILQLETARQRFVAEPGRRGATAEALLGKMVEQLTARRDGADAAAAAALDQEATRQADAIFAQGSSADGAAQEVGSLSYNLTALLRRLDRVAVPAADHRKAVDRAVQLAGKDADQVYLVVDRGFDDKGAHQGYVVSVMPPTLDDKRVVPASALQGQTVEKDAQVTFEGKSYQVAEVGDAKVLLSRKQNLYGLLTQAVTSGEGSMVEVVMGAGALARAQQDWPKGAGAFPSGELRSAVTIFHKGLVDPAYAPDAASLNWQARDDLLIKMYEKVRTSVARRFQGALDKFTAWEGDPPSLARELVTIGRSLGFDKTWLELRHLFGYDWTVTQDSAIPALNLIMAAVNAGTADERERLTRRMPEEPAFKALLERIHGQIEALRDAKKDVETPRFVPPTTDDLGNEIVPGYQDPDQLFAVVDSMPAMREEIYRLLGFGFDPGKDLGKDTVCRNAAERAYRDAYLDHRSSEKIRSLVIGGLILVGTIVATAITGGLAGPLAAMALGTGIAAIQAVVDVHESNKRTERTLAAVQAGGDAPESYDAAIRDATSARVMGVVNVALGPLLGLANGSGKTPWFLSLLFDSALGAGLAAADGRTWNGQPGDAAESVIIAAFFGAAGSLGGRAAHAAIEGSHSRGLARTPESGERVRLEVHQGKGEVRVVTEDGQVLRTGKVLRRGVDELGRPTNEVILSDSRPGHQGEVFTLSLGQSRVVAEPVAAPAEAALPAVQATTVHPVLGNTPVQPAGPAPVERFTFAKVGETVRLSAPGVPAGDYRVISTDQRYIQIEVNRPVTLYGGNVIEAAGVEYMVTRGNASLPNGVGLNEIAVFDMNTTPALRGKKNGDVVSLNGRNWRIRAKAGLPAGHVRLVAETAVDPTMVANGLPPGGTMRRRMSASGTTATPVLLEGGRLVEPTPEFVRAGDVQRIGAQPALSQAQFDSLLYPGGKPRGTGEAWVSLEEPLIKIDLGGHVQEFYTKDLRVGGRLRDAAGTIWELTQVDFGQGTYTAQEVANPANVAQKKLYPRAWKVEGYDPATGLVRLSRTEIRVEGTHHLERTIPGFRAVSADGSRVGASITDSAGRVWQVVTVDAAAHTIELRSGTTTQTLPYSEAARQQLWLADFGAPIPVTALTPGQVIMDLLGRPWEVFEVDRGTQPRVSLRRGETRVEPVENLRTYNPRGARARVDLEPATEVMLSGDRVRRGIAFVARYLKEGTGVPRVGSSKVSADGTGPTQSRTLPQSHNPAATADARGVQANLPVATREHFFRVEGAGGVTQRVRVLVPDADVVIPAQGGRPAERLSPEQVLSLAKDTLANMPEVMVGRVKELRFNPAENAEDILWRRGNPQFGGSAMTAGHGIIDVYPAGMRRTGTEALSVYLQITWHEMGHSWAQTFLGHYDGDHLWRRAVEADGPRNLPSKYAGTNLGEDLAEAVRLYVASNGGRDPIFDVYMQQWIDGAVLSQRYRNRFRTLEAYFGQRPSEMQALQKEFLTTMSPVLKAAGVAAGGALGKMGYDLVKSLLDDQEDASPDPGKKDQKKPPPAPKPTILNAPR